MVVIKVFAEETVKELKKYLPEEYRDLELNVIEMRKNNGVYRTGIEVENPKSKGKSIVYVENYYSDICNGKAIDEVMNNLVETIKDTSHTLDGFSKENLYDFEKIKDCLSLKLINTRANRERLVDMPHTKLEDLSIIAYLDLEKGGDLETATTEVINAMLDIWGVKWNEVYETGIRNMEQIHGCVLQNVEHIVDWGLGIAGEPPNLLKEKDSFCEETLTDMYALSNEKKLFGASAILCPEVRKKLDALFPEGMYVIPSSLHELLLLPKRQEMSVEVLENMVKEVNRDCLDKVDILSNRVYELDKERGQMKLALELMEKDREVSR